jgi:hypothetical protein
LRQAGERQVTTADRLEAGQPGQRRKIAQLEHDLRVGHRGSDRSREFGDALHLWDLGDRHADGAGLGDGARRPSYHRSEIDELR